VNLYKKQAHHYYKSFILAIADSRKKVLVIGFWGTGNYICSLMELNFFCKKYFSINLNLDHDIKALGKY
jgi:hypothetical protein